MLGALVERVAPEFYRWHIAKAQRRIEFADMRRHGRRPGSPTGRWGR